MKPAKFLDKVVDLTEKQLKKRNISDDFIIYWDVDTQKHPIITIISANNNDETYTFDLEEYRIRQNEEDISVKDIFKSDIKTYIFNTILHEQEIDTPRHIILPIDNDGPVVANPSHEICIDIDYLRLHECDIIPQLISTNSSFVREFTATHNKSLLLKPYTDEFDICYLIEHNNQMEYIPSDISVECMEFIQTKAIENINLADISIMNSITFSSGLGDDIKIIIPYADELTDDFKNSPALLFNQENEDLQYIKQNSYIIFPSQNEMLFIMTGNHTEKKDILDILSEIGNDNNSFFTGAIYKFDTTNNHLQRVDNLEQEIQEELF